MKLSKYSTWFRNFLKVWLFFLIKTLLGYPLITSSVIYYSRVHKPQRLRSGVVRWQIIQSWCEPQSKGPLCGWTCFTLGQWHHAGIRVTGGAGYETSGREGNHASVSVLSIRLLTNSSMFLVQKWFKIPYCYIRFY